MTVLQLNQLVMCYIVEWVAHSEDTEFICLEPNNKLAACICKFVMRACYGACIRVVVGIYLIHV